MIDGGSIHGTHHLVGPIGFCLFSPSNYWYVPTHPIGAAYNLQALQQAGITHIVNLSPSAQCKYPSLFECLHIDTIYDDAKYENRISQYFNKTLPFIDHALSSGGRILVHCWRGKSRSVSTIVAYLIEHNHMTPDEALERIRITRSIAQPNDGYLEELDEFFQVVANRTAAHHG